MEEKTSFWESTNARWVITAIFYIVVFGGITLCEAFMPKGMEILVIIPIGIFTFFGWKALNKIQPSMFLWMSWFGWFTYFFIKFVLSVLVGLFVAPWQLGKIVTNHMQQRG